MALKASAWGYIFGGQVLANIYDALFPKRDAWTKLSDSDRSNLILSACQVGSVAVLAGEVYSLDEVFTDLIPQYGQEYVNWKAHSNNNTFVGWINKAKSEITIAKDIVNQASRNKDAAYSRLEAANFDHVSKTQVSSLINGTYYDVETDTETTEPSDTSLDSSNAGFSFNQITGWLSANPLVAVGIVAGLGLLGYFMFSSKSNQVVLQIPQPQKLK